MMKDIKQHQQVIDTMIKNGGYATLGFLYHNVDVSSWGTKTPFKSINRIVQDERFFFKIRPGLWALNDYREKVLKSFDLEIERSEKSNEFSHYYFQGLLVEIGNLKGFQTYIPNQDKNKLFLDKPLGSISSLDKILPFSYENIVKRAQTVDVIWFNDRKMPSSFFEVEHSTDIYNSLLKYHDLRDFYSSFCIVADLTRKREYESKISSSVFLNLRQRITFMSYEELSEIHASSFKLKKAEKDFTFLKN